MKSIQMELSEVIIITRRIPAERYRVCVAAVSLAVLMGSLVADTTALPHKANTYIIGMIFELASSMRRFGTPLASTHDDSIIYCKRPSPSPR